VRKWCGKVLWSLQTRRHKPPVQVHLIKYAHFSGELGCEKNLKNCLIMHSDFKPLALLALISWPSLELGNDWKERFNKQCCVNMMGFFFFPKLYTMVISAVAVQTDTELALAWIVSLPLLQTFSGLTYCTCSWQVAELYAFSVIPSSISPQVQ